MSKQTRYTDEPLGQINIINDRLPLPNELVMREDTVKVTLSLTKSSVEFFKEQAEKYHIPYQKMIRSLVDKYAEGNK